MEKIRVLHFIEGLSKGGAERRLINDLTFLDKRAFNHSVCIVFDRMELKKEIVGLGIPIHNLKAKRGIDVPAFLRLVKLIRDSNFSIIHTQLFWADFYGRLAGRLCGVKLLLSTVQSAVYEPDNSYLYSFKRRVVDGVLGKYFTTGFVAVSEFVRESMIRRLGIKQKKITIIPNSIDASNFIPCENAEKEKTRKGLCLNEKDAVLLTVGRLNPPKGHRFLIEAMYKLKKSFPGLVLLVAGDGPSREDLVLLRDKMGLKECVRFLGERHDIRDLLCVSDIFILPTLSEGLPVSLLEAMAMRKICLASGIEPVKEIIEQGVNGFLFEPGNSEDLAGALSRSLNLKGESLRIPVPVRVAIRARDDVLRKFDALENARRLEKLYKEMVEG